MIQIKLREPTVLALARNGGTVSLYPTLGAGPTGATGPAGPAGTGGGGSGGLSITDNNDGTATVTSSGTSTATDNNDGTATIAA